MEDMRGSLNGGHESETEGHRMEDMRGSLNGGHESETEGH